MSKTTSNEMLIIFYIYLFNAVKSDVLIQSFTHIRRPVQTNMGKNCYEIGYNSHVYIFNIFGLVFIGLFLNPADLLFIDETTLTLDKKWFLFSFCFPYSKCVFFGCFYLTLFIQNAADAMEPYMENGVQKTHRANAISYNFDGEIRVAQTAAIMIAYMKRPLIKSVKMLHRRNGCIRAILVCLLFLLFF